MSLVWRGWKTIDAARTALAERVDVAVHLPAGFHHSVFSRFAPAASTAAAESLDIAGGGELLTHLAHIRGLDRLAQLAAPVLQAQAQAQVHIVSPSPTITISCRRDRAGEPAPR